MGRIVLSWTQMKAVLLSEGGEPRGPERSDS